MLEALRGVLVCFVIDNLGINKSAASKHLSLLNKLGVIKMEKEGTRVNCSLQMHCVTQMMQCVIDKE